MVPWEKVPAVRSRELEQFAQWVQGSPHMGCSIDNSSWGCRGCIAPVAVGWRTRSCKTIDSVRWFGACNVSRIETHVSSAVAFK
jgi:hypothetical protein